MTTEVNPVQLAKAPLPIFVTLLGMEIDVRALQPKKADRSMLITVLGMVTEVTS